MTEKMCRLVLVLCLFAVGSATMAAAAFTIPIISSATYDAGTQVLTLSGVNLTEPNQTPTVEWNHALLPVMTATATQITATLPNTTAPGSYLVIVHRSAIPFDVALIDMTIDAAAAPGPAGPMGSPGLPGSPGPQGPPGPKGDKGGLTSFNDVNGLPCSVGGTAATMVLSFATNGVATLTCNVPPPPPPPPPPVPPDNWPKTFGAAHNLGSVPCGASFQVTGATAPAGTEDWFVFNWPGQCGKDAFGFPIPGGTARVSLGSNLASQFDIRTDATTNVISGTTGWSLNNPGTYYIRVYGQTPAATGTWAMTISVQP